MRKICYICGSDRFVDGHHYDCRHGEISPEKVPLCRRCHRTYHDWGIGAFSPDTTEKALEVENKRREILRPLPPGHPAYRNLPPMKLEDVRRSGYWYKKHGITPPRRKRALPPFKIPHNPPLCGVDWLLTHLKDYTPLLSATVSVADKRGVLKAALRKK